MKFEDSKSQLICETEGQPREKVLDPALTLTAYFAVKENYKWYEFANEEHRKDWHITLAAASKDIGYLGVISREILHETDFMLFLLGNKYTMKLVGSLIYTSQKLLQNEDFSLNALKLNRYVISCIPDEIINNQSFIRKMVKIDYTLLGKMYNNLFIALKTALAAVQHNGAALRYLQPFQDTRQVVLAAARHDRKAIEYASPELQTDSEIMQAAAS